MRVIGEMSEVVSSSSSSSDRGGGCLFGSRKKGR